MRHLAFGRISRRLILPALVMLLAAVWAGAARADDPEEITVSLFRDYHPISGINLAGEPSGIIPDLWRLWSEKTGVRVNFAIDDFAESIRAVREGRADVHGSLFRNDERAEWLTFSRTLHEFTTGLYYWAGDGAAPTMESLRGRAVGAVRGTHQEKYVREGGFGFRVRAFRNVLEMLRALARGEIAAIVHEDLSMDNLVRRAGVQGEIARLPQELMRNAIHVGVPRGRQDLLDLVNWGFWQISWAEYGAIESRWITDPNDRFYRPRGTQVPFNASEKEWLARNKTVRLGSINSWPPMSFVNEAGKPEGMSQEFAELLNDRLGGILHFTQAPWDELLADLRAGRIDALMDIRPLRSREDFANFTQPYLIAPHVFVVPEKAPLPKGFGDLNGKKLAVERGFSTVFFVRKNFPDVQVIEYADTLAALKAVASGEAAAFAGNSAVVRYLTGLPENDLRGLLHSSPVPGRQSLSAIAVREDWPILRDILDKALHGLSTSQVDRVTGPWLDGGRSRGLDLTAREQRWLARHLDEPIRVHVGNWPPFNFEEDGEHKGLAFEYLQFIFKELGLNMEAIRNTWSNALKGVSETHKIDVLSTIAYSKFRERYVLFTKDYLSYPRVIVTRNEHAILAGLRDLEGKTVAVERNFIAQELLTRDYPAIKLHIVENTHEALEAVSLGKADAYVGNLAAASFHIERHGLSNLKIAAPTEYDNDSQAIGVRKDWPELASMIDKVLEAMTESEHAAIRNKALTVKFDHGVDMKEVLGIAVPVFGVVLIIIFIVVHSNRRLAGEVRERKKAEERLTEREQRFRSLLESAPDATVIVDQKGIIVRVNKQAEIMFGADRDQLLGKPIEMLVPENIKQKHTAYRDGFVAASAPRSMGANAKLLARRLNGILIPVEISLSPIETAEGTLIAASVRDVSERRKQEAQLAEKDLQLTAALENMSGGMFMVDRELIIRVFNKKFVDMYHLPEVKVGTPLRDILLIRAARGDYGDGDREAQVAERLQGYIDGSVARVEDVVFNRVIEGFRQPTDDGGIVAVFTDITERKKAEEALAEQHEKLEDLSHKLSRYLSPQIYEAIFAGASDAQVQTERKKLTVFFSDIKNFTATTEEMEPEDMTYLLNDYLTKMTEIALEYGGTIDKYIGDAIMVFFGDPETKGVKQDALAAVRMAIAMQRRMVDLRAKWADMGFKYPFHIRCGVNTGYCNVGNFGSDQRIDYTIIGGQVNLAARLESICEPDGVTISYETYTHVRDEIDADPLEPIQVKGIKEPVKPFAVEGIFDDWKADERYIRRDDILGLRLWVDLMRMDEERRLASIKELEEAIGILKARKQIDAADD